MKRLFEIAREISVVDATAAVEDDRRDLSKSESVRSETAEGVRYDRVNLLNRLRALYRRESTQGSNDARRALEKGSGCVGSKLR